MSESTLWTWLKGARKYYGEGLQIRRIENGVSTGDADTDGILNGRDFAIELKACKRPVMGATKLAYHEVTEAQVEWHSKRLRAGGASCFLVQVGSDRFLVHGRFASLLRGGLTLSACNSYGRLVGTPHEAIYIATQQRNTL